MPRTKTTPKRSTRRVKSAQPAFQITYANLSSALSDPGMLARFDKAFAQVSAAIGEHARTYPMVIAGEERLASESFTKTTPINTELPIGHFQKGSEQDAHDAVAAAKAAFPSWSSLPWKRRVALMRRWLR